MSKVGRKTDLTKELIGKIKKSILAGNNLKKTAEICEINELTLYDWSSNNYLNLSDKIDNWKLDRKLNMATDNLEAYLKMNTTNVVKVGEDTEVKTDTGLERIKADMTKFTLETIGKKNYGKNMDLTSEGKALPTPIYGGQSTIQGHEVDTEDIQSKEED